MYLRLACLPFLLFSVLFQDSGDLFKRHYEEASRAHSARDYRAAEREFNAILGEAYQRLGKIYSAQGRYTDSVGPFEASVAIRPNQLESVVELSIAYFRTRQYQKSRSEERRVGKGCRSGGSAEQSQQKAPGEDGR